jgi:hypothetical protein
VVDRGGCTRREDKADDLRQRRSRAGSRAVTVGWHWGTGGDGDADASAVRSPCKTHGLP